MITTKQFKTCPDCKIQKTHTEFYECFSRYDGLDIYCKECKSKRNKKSYNLQANWENKKDYKLKTRYGISLAEYDEILKNQGGVCALCKRPPQNNELAVDHNHTTNKVRGLLCQHCNRFVVGFIEASDGYLNRLLDYLK